MQESAEGIVGRRRGGRRPEPDINGYRPEPRQETEEQKMSAETHARPESRERNSRGYGKVHPPPAAGKDHLYPETDTLMEAVVERENMLAAWKQVRDNGGAPGIDGVTVNELWPWLLENWPQIKEELLGDEYRPQPVRGVDIPKPGRKGKRQLGIPVVLDRLIMQALNQVLQPRTIATASDPKGVLTWQ